MTSQRGDSPSPSQTPTASSEEIETVHTGSCLCGAVRFEVRGAIRDFRHCHCRTCRKIHGTAYGSSALVPAADFRVLQGEENLRRYESSPGKRRCFCGTCGSHLFAYYEHDPSFVVLRLGTIDDLEALTPIAHIWVSEKAPWYTIRDDVPQFPGPLESR